MIPLADLDRDELEALARLHRPSEIDVLQARVDVARRRSDEAFARYRAESERALEMTRMTKRLGEGDGWKGEAFRDAMSDLAAQQGRSRTAWNVYLRAEKKADAAERALNRARAEKGGRA